MFTPDRWKTERTEINGEPALSCLELLASMGCLDRRPRRYDPGFRDRSRPDLPLCNPDEPGRIPGDAG
jgi:hypothetical protein